MRSGWPRASCSPADSEGRRHHVHEGQSQLMRTRAWAVVALIAALAHIVVAAPDYEVWPAARAISGTDRLTVDNTDVASKNAVPHACLMTPAARSRCAARKSSPPIPASATARRSRGSPSTRWCSSSGCSTPRGPSSRSTRWRSTRSASRCPTSRASRSGRRSGGRSRKRSTRASATPSRAR